MAFGLFSGTFISLYQLVLALSQMKPLGLEDTVFARLISIRSVFDQSDQLFREEKQKEVIVNTHGRGSSTGKEVRKEKSD